MSQLTVRRLVSPVNLLQIVIILLTVITALVHLQRGIGMMGAAPAGPSAHPGGSFAGAPGGAHPGGGGRGGGRSLGFSLLAMLPFPLSTLFILNGVAYLVLGALLYLPALKKYRSIIRVLLMVLAAVTIVAYFLIAGTRFNLLGYIDKPVEALLIILLFIEGWRSTRVKTA